MRKLVSAEQIAGIYFFPNIVKTAIVAVGYDRLAALLEFHKVIHNLTTEKCTAIFKRWLINNDRCPFCFNALHDALNRGLPEVIRVRLHRQAENANHNVVFPARIVIFVCLVCASDLQNTVSNVVLAGAVRFHDGFDEVFRHIRIVRQQLLGVLRQSVSAVTKAGIIVVTANARIKADALDNLLGV